MTAQDQKRLHMAREALAAAEAFAQRGDVDQGAANAALGAARDRVRQLERAAARRAASDAGMAFAAGAGGCPQPVE